MSPEYLEDIFEIMKQAIEQRNSVIRKKKTKSVAIPTELTR